MSHLSVSWTVWAKSPDSVHKPPFWKREVGPSVFGAAFCVLYVPKERGSGFPLDSNISTRPRSEEPRTQNLKSHLMKTQSLKILPLKPGVGQCIAMHATLTAKDFFLANFYHSGPFTCISPSTSPKFFPVLAAANTGCCVGAQNKLGHLAGCRFPCWVPAENK